ncbi:hypothetical protein [Ilumatobacter sp.]|uniref:hypothetical protein n=1 Tax=Ilumatobacter sp. TaxID=1967498 RepID=UPI003C680128
MSAEAVNPLTRLDKLANWSLILSGLSFFCGLFTMIPAFILAGQAKKGAAELGTTSSDQKIQIARIVAIVGLAFWIILVIAAVVAG